MVKIDKIKALAQEKGIKLGYLARQINVPHTYFADIKNKNRDIPDERLSVIAKELSTTVAYLRGKTDMKDIENKQFDTEHPNEEAEKKSAAAVIELTENESNLLTAYRQLNTEGKTQAEHSIFDLASNELYQLPQFRAEIVRQIPEDYDGKTSAFAYLPVAAFQGGISYVKLTKIQLARANEIHGMTPRENPMIEKYRKKNRKP